VHETFLFKKILQYLEKEEKAASRAIKRIHVTLSEFGGLSKEHFLEHFRESDRGHRWDGVRIEFKKIPYGPEFEITKIEFSVKKLRGQP